MYIYIHVQMYTRAEMYMDEDEAVVKGMGEVGKFHCIGDSLSMVMGMV